MNAEDIFKKHGGQLRMSEAIKLGISRTKLYSMRDKGIIEQISRGLYRLSELPYLSYPDLVIVSKRFLQSVICLISALSFHHLTTQIPHEVYIAVSQKANLPSGDTPPISAHRFSDASFLIGIEKHILDGAEVKIYDPEKTLVDCFKFRNKIGMDIVLEALKKYRNQGRMKLDKLQEYAKACRVEKVMRPYLEVSL